MAKPNGRYKQMEQYMIVGLLAALVFFVIFLIAAGNGVIWLKVIAAIISVLIAAMCIFLLLKTKELLRPRSMWMTVAAISIIVCTIFSLILNFPSPNPLA